MFFTEYQFIASLILFFVVHHLVPARVRWINLLLSSLFIVGIISQSLHKSFYALYYSFGFAVINYLSALLLERIKSGNTKDLVLKLIIVVDVGFLIGFKYLGLLVEAAFGISSIFGEVYDRMPVMNIVAPIGISFFTFQGIAYQLDVKRGHSSAEKDFFKFLLFIIYFPKFVSGPVERTKSMLPQISGKIELTPDKTVTGAKLFFWGLFKKLVIGDHLLLYISDVYKDEYHFSGIYLFFILLLQPMQIYCDFSGYTDIARGISRMFGVELLPNFKNPFTATNVTNFWKRWHMSLTNWCGDYIYKHIILKRRKWKKWGAVYAVMITFVVIGIWHGSRWTYIVLGFMQGFAMSYEFFTKRWRLKWGAKIPKPLNNIISRALTYMFFGLSLVFLNAPDMEHALRFIGNIFVPDTTDSFATGIGNFMPYLTIRILLILGILYLDYRSELKQGLDSWMANRPVYLRWTVYVGLLLAFMSLGNFGKSDFVYAGF